MNLRLSAFWVHGLHLSAILLLGYFVWQDRCRDGEARLFKSIYVTQGFAREQMEQAHEKMLDLIRWQIEVYLSAINLDYLDRVTRINRICDSVIDLLNVRPLSLVQADQVLQVLHDSLSTNVKDDPVLAAQFDTLLLRSGPPDGINLLSNARVQQHLMLRNDLRINILLAKEQALYYFLQRISGCDIRLDAFQPFWAPEVVCPMANESFGVTAFLSTYSYYYLHPKSATVWLNGARVPVKNGNAQFSTRFDQTGPQPLAIRVEMHGRKGDTLQVFEKTYTVQVK